MYPVLIKPATLPNTSNHSLGPADQSTVAKVEVHVTDEERARLKRVEARPPLSEILNLHDFEVNSVHLQGPRVLCLIRSSAKQAIARQVMPEKAWAYYSSAADDEITNRENHAAYHRLAAMDQWSAVADTPLVQNMVPSTDYA